MPASQENQQQQPKIKTYEVEFVERSAISGAEYNPRQIDKQMLDELCASILEYGFVQPVIARREDGLIVGGHQRMAAYDLLVKRHGADVVDGRGIPVMYVENMSDVEAKKLNLTLNKVQGDWDFDKLADLVQDIMDTEDIVLNPEDLDNLDSIGGFSATELADLIEVSEMITPDLGEVEAFEKLESGIRLISFKMPDDEATEVEAILRRFGADEHIKRPNAFLLAMRTAVTVAEENKDIAAAQARAEEEAAADRAAE